MFIIKMYSLICELQLAIKILEYYAAYVHVDKTYGTLEDIN